MVTVIEKNINEIKVGERFRKDIGDLSELKRSIAQLGLLQPLVILTDGSLVAGYRRLEALKQLGMNKAPCYIAMRLNDAIDAMIAELDENTCRKAFEPSEAGRLYSELSKKAKAENKENKIQNLIQYKTMEAATRATTTEQVHLPSSVEKMDSFLNQNENAIKEEGNRPTESPSEKAAKITGLSESSVKRAKKVVESGDESIIKEMDKTGNINKAYNKVKEKEKKEVEPEKEESDNDLEDGFILLEQRHLYPNLWNYNIDAFLENNMIVMKAQHGIYGYLGEMMVKYPTRFKCDIETDSGIDTYFGFGNIPYMQSMNKSIDELISFLEDRYGKQIEI